MLPLKRPDQTSYRADCRSSRSNLRTISVPQHGSQKTVPQGHGAALEDANIKLGAVASDVFGASGRAMLLAMMKGESNAEALAELSKGRLRNKIPELRRALEG